MRPICLIFRAISVLILIGPMLTPANAKVVSYSFTALIDDLSTDRIGEEGPVPSFDAPFIGVVSVGDAITGTLTYDTLSPLTYSFEDVFGYETHTEAATLTYRVGNIEREFSMPGPQSIITRLSQGSIWFRTLDYPIGGGLIDYSTSLFFAGASPELFSASPIPEYLNINNFPTHRVLIDWNIRVRFGYNVNMGAEIITLAPIPSVPEPTAPLLVGAGLGIFCLRRAASQKTLLRAP